MVEFKSTILLFFFLLSLSFSSLFPSSASFWIIWIFKWTSQYVLCDKGVPLSPSKWVQS